MKGNSLASSALLRNMVQMGLSRMSSKKIGLFSIAVNADCVVESLLKDATNKAHWIKMVALNNILCSHLFSVCSLEFWAAAFIFVSLIWY